MDPGPQWAGQGPQGVPNPAKGGTSPPTPRSIGSTTLGLKYGAPAPKDRASRVATRHYLRPLPSLVRRMSSDASGTGAPFQRATSVFLYGTRSPLLDWVAWAFAASAPGEYYWTDVRARDEAVDPDGPIARHAVPEARLRVRDPQDLAPDHAGANAAITAGIRPDESHPQLEQLSDFLRLPEPTRSLIASRRPGSPPYVVVISNGHLLLPLYSRPAVRSTLQTLTAHGLAILDVFPAVPTENRFLFDNVWRLEPSPLDHWQRARLDVEKAAPFGPLTVGRDQKLEGLPHVGASLARALGRLAGSSTA